MVLLEHNLPDKITSSDVIILEFCLQIWGFGKAKYVG